MVWLTNYSWLSERNDKWRWVFIPQTKYWIQSDCIVIKEFIWIFKLQIEDKTGIIIDSTDPILQWCIRWAAMVTSRYLVGVDGRTGWERRRDIWSGPARNSNEMFIGTNEGVTRAYIVKRQDPKSRWNGRVVKLIKGTPRNTNPNSTDATVKRAQEKI